MKLPLLLLAISSILLVSCSNDRSSGHTHDSSQDLATIPGIWPPVLTNIENQQANSTGLRSRARGSVVDAARVSVLNNPQVRQALGSDYQSFDATLEDTKSYSIASFLFFNYANNTTVEAVLQKDGSVLVNTIDATEFQPAENSTEIANAIELGRSDLLAAGHDLTNLLGTAMLAHPTDSVSTTDPYFPERILYVTFGRGEGELPDFHALVNLGTAAVLDSGLLK